MQLDIADGEFFVLLGPSGAGKTTTLRLIAGLETPDAGSLRMNGADLTAAAPALRDCAFVFQQYSLYPHLTVYDNMAFPLRAPMRRIDEAEIKRRVERSPRCCTSRASCSASHRAVGRRDAARGRSAARWCASRAST
jgi:multiple sugar transport system ATP-binding protein